jgi:tRNA threonylcarbamoyladenosine biosynthesis protein TsaB
MKILFFDATQNWIHIAVVTISDHVKSQCNIDYEFVELCPRESSFRLVSEIKKALNSAKCEKPDLIVCLSGPGSFTGIRITITTGRNLAQLWRIPIYVLDSLEAYAAFFTWSYDLATFIALDGKQKKRYFGWIDDSRYFGSFDWEDSKIHGKIQDMSETKHLFVFSGSHPSYFPSDSIKIEETLPRFMPILESIKEKILGLDLEANSFGAAIPNYIRGSYIETNKK